MKVLFYSASGTSLFFPSLKLSPHSFEYLEAELSRLSDAVIASGSDIAFVGGFPESEALLDQFSIIFKHKPQIEIVLCASNISPSFILKAMKLGLRDVVDSINIESIIDVINRSFARVKSDLLPKATKKVIGFMSAKGGDGGTCVAANMATAIANLSEQTVLVLDLSLPFGDIEMFMTSERRKSDLADFSDEIDRLDGPLMLTMVEHIKSNLDLIPSPASIDRLIHIKPEHIDKIIDLAAKYYDYVFIDIGAGIDPLSIHALGMLDQLIVIATMTVPSFKRATQVIGYWDELGFDGNKLSIVINRFQSNADIKVNDFEKAFGKIVVKMMAQDNSGVQESLLKGIPLVDLHPQSEFSKAIKEWASSWLGIKKEKSLWQRLRIK